MTSETTPALQQVTVLEATWTDCPDDVIDEIKKIWIDNNFGNDHFYYKWYEDSDGAEDSAYPVIAAYLKEHNVTGPVLIHWWW